jgi:hypothetical protein
MLHRTGKRSGTIHAMNQISPKLAQIKHSVIPIPGEDGQVFNYVLFLYKTNYYFFFRNSFIQFIVLVKQFKYYQQKLVQKN